MLSEVSKNEVKDTGNSESKGFQNIKPESDLTMSDANEFWDKTLGNNVESPESTAIDTDSKLDDNGMKYRDGDQLIPNSQYEINGYKYKTDENGRIVSAEGKLKIKEHEGRKDIADSRDTVARGEMKSEDDRGHLIADRFEGGNGLENMVPMDGKLNKGDYAKMEGMLSDAVNDGCDVHLKVEPVYSDNSFRPSEFRISYSIDGEITKTVFKNGSDS